MGTIILYGCSLLLDAVEYRLRLVEQDAVLRLSGDYLEMDQLAALPPGVLIYDHVHTSPDTLHSLFYHSAGWTLIGLMGSGDLLVTRRQYRAALDDLLVLVQEEAAGLSSRESP